MHAVPQTPEGEHQNQHRRAGHFSSTRQGAAAQGRDSSPGRWELTRGGNRVHCYINMMDTETFSAGSRLSGVNPEDLPLDLPSGVVVDTLKPLPATSPSPSPGEEQSVGRAQQQAQGLRSLPALRVLYGAPHQPSLGPPSSWEILAQQVRSTGC